jgi:hypothetical protein
VRISLGIAVNDTGGNVSIRVNWSGGSGGVGLRIGGGFSWYTTPTTATTPVLNVSSNGIIVVNADLGISNCPADTQVNVQVALSTAVGSVLNGGSVVAIETLV